MSGTGFEFRICDFLYYYNDIVKLDFGGTMIISVHEYTLKPDTDQEKFEETITDAKSRGLFDLSGMKEYHFLKGIRGTRKNKYTAIWIYENEEAWFGIWGPEGNAVSKVSYPNSWKIWEDEILAPYLAEDPDTINFTSYRKLEV